MPGEGGGGWGVYCAYAFVCTCVHICGMDLCGVYVFERGGCVHAHGV